MNLPISIFLPVPASPLGRISLGPTCQEPSLLAWLEAPGMWCYTCDAQQVRYRFAAKKGKVKATPKWEMLRSMHIENLVILMSKYFQESKTSMTMEARKLYKRIKAKRVLLFLG